MHTDSCAPPHSSRMRARVRAGAPRARLHDSRMRRLRQRRSHAVPCAIAVHMVAAPHTAEHAAQTRRPRACAARWMDGRPGAAQPTKADGVGVRSSPARCNALPTVATHRHTLQRHHTTLQRSTTRCNAARRSARVAPADLPVEKVVGGLDEERAARGLGVGDVQRDCAGTHTAAECGSTGIDARRARG